MQIKEKNEIKQLLSEQIIQLRKQLDLTFASSKTVELDQTLAGRVSRIDAIQQQKMAQSSYERDKRLLADLENTLDRLSHVDYGRCLECDENIPFARLSIKPESKYCINCQQMME